MNFVNTCIRRGSFCVLAAALMLAAPVKGASAQKPIKNASYVTLAISNNPTEVGRIKSFKDGRGVIVMDGDHLVPEALSTMLGAYASSRRHGGIAGKDVTLRASQSQPLPMSSRVRAHYLRILERLAAADERVVPGVGKVRAIDIPLVGVP